MSGIPAFDTIGRYPQPRRMPTEPETSTAIVGLDLAWKDGRPSGLCVLRDHGDVVELVLVECRVDTPEGWAHFLSSLGPNSVVAVDAPLAWRTACHAERALGRAFGRYHAAPYMAGSDFLRRLELTCGPRLAEALIGEGFDLDPRKLQLAGAPGRFAFETYPHAFHVRTFALERRIPYKKGRMEGRRAGMNAYQEHLARALCEHAPAVAADPRMAVLLAPEATAARGPALKALEDQLDAVTCVLAALFAWRNGVREADLFGEPVEGYIVIPSAAP